MKTFKLNWNYVVLSLVTAMLITVTACSKSEEIIDEPTNTDEESAILKINTAIDESTASNIFD
jgi:hypothetical protein